MILSLVLACRPATQQPSNPSSATLDSAVDSAPVEDPLEVLDVQGSLSDQILTVSRVSWRTEAPTTGHVEFGFDEGYGKVTNTTEEGTEHEVLLLGMPSDTEVHFQVVASDGERVGRSEALTITTGPLPSGAPNLTVTGEVDGQWAYQAIPFQGTSYVIGIIDDEGRLVWYDFPEPKGNLMRALVTPDFSEVVYVWAGSQDTLETGRIVRVSMDGSERTEIAFPYVDHDADVLPDGTIAAIVVTGPPEDLEGYDERDLADRIVELAPDGTQTEIWNAWDHIDFHAIEGISGEQNFTHGNALDYVEEEDAYYISLKTLGTIAKVDRATGETVWMINGKLNQFTFPEGTEIVQLQHQLERLDDGLLIFDNGPRDRGYSRVVELVIDEETLEAEQTWEYIRDPTVQVFAKGDVHRFDDGSTQVVWSISGEIQNVTPEGEVTWQLNTDLGQALTFVQVLDDLYLRP